MLLAFTLLAALITDCAELNAQLLNRTKGDTFVVCGTVSYVGEPKFPTFFFIENGTIAATIHCFHPTHLPRPGDRIKAYGYIGAYKPDFSHAVETNVQILASGTVPAPRKLSLADIAAGLGDSRVVTLTGRIYASFLDEIDSNYHWLAVEDLGTTLFVAFIRDARYNDANLPRHGDLVELTGVCRRTVHYNRRRLNRIVTLSSPKDVRILARSTANPFDSPDLEPDNDGDPQTLVNLPPRKIVGRVLATWQGNRLLMTSDDGLRHTVTLAETGLPACGTRIEVVGLVETDLYQVNFSEAAWRPADAAPADGGAAVDSPPSVSLHDLLTDPQNVPGINYSFHGQTVRVRGTVSVRQDSSEGRDLVSLESDGRILTVDASSAAGAMDSLVAGSRAEVSGVVVVQTENWRPNRAFPRTTGVRLVLRSSDDVRILSRPPWWTPLRLMLVIGALVLVLLGLSVWNRVLNRLVERRSRQLTKEEISRDLARLKTEERTRLAVELHDTIAQNLTGVALQLDAVELAAENNPPALPARLTLTRQRLQNCRDELRNVLWDLRSRAFEERLLSVAIRRTVAPHLGTAQVDIDCDIPCRRLSDNAIHQILSIVRELVVNAVRHGEAKRIVIAGEMSENRIDLSVSDDGKGFDPDSRPGAESGHFGLQGLSERVHLLEGSVVLESAPGKGTVARLSQLRTDI